MTRHLHSRLEAAHEHGHEGPCVASGIAAHTPTHLENTGLLQLPRETHIKCPIRERGCGDPSQSIWDSVRDFRETSLLTIH
ncbi:hypothetical protein H6P81_012568 [Aristolochia fimbriata]|uniref:Uncharacterized protein n=1 Tax=Aristolochia fimbriata TaxID=158543 RepID=A0AAV7EEB3_ARIFI|nr:hypothetical protein H6P81_012568 [Aristolochia fimbriata]